MPIINVTPGQVGLVGVFPSIAYINTSDTVGEVTTTGYLNKEVANGLQLSLPCIAAVSTQATPTSAPAVGWYQVSHVGTNWSLIPGSSTALALANGDLFIGNVSGVAVGVPMTGIVAITNAGVTSIPLASGNILVGSAGGIAASVAMSGDATIIASGALTIANNAITTPKILNANVTLAKLAAGITPAYIIKLGGKNSDAGGSATVTITATGTVATDLAFAAIQSSANPVSIQSVTAGTDQIVVVCSGTPGANVICWEAHRAAS